MKLEAVFISNPTERGDVYSAAELKELRRACDRHGLKLGMDGARLPYAVAALGESPAHLTESVDFLTLSLTKSGGLFGSAIVFKKPLAREDYDRFMKGVGHIIDTTYYISGQFAWECESNDWWDQAGKATARARSLAISLKAIGFDVEPVRSNAVFVHMDQGAADRLQKLHTAYVWDRPDTVLGQPQPCLVRFMIHPNITDDDTDELLNFFAHLRDSKLNDTHQQ